MYADLRTQFGDLTKDGNLVEYFQAVLDRQEELEEEEDRMQQYSSAAVVASTNP